MTLETTRTGSKREERAEGKRGGHVGGTVFLELLHAVSAEVIGKPRARLPLGQFLARPVTSARFSQSSTG
jgi:hypothetical protein